MEDVGLEGIGGNREDGSKKMNCECQNLHLPF